MGLESDSTGDKAGAKTTESIAQPVLASFPRAGRTWLATLIHGAVAGSADGGMELLQGGDHRVLLTHDDFDPAQHGGPTVLVLRDPADQLVSFFHYMSDHLGEYRGTLAESVHSENQGVPRLARWFNTWGEVAPRCFATTYEALRTDTATELVKVLDGLHLAPHADLDLEGLVAACDFSIAHAFESAAAASGADKGDAGQDGAAGRARDEASESKAGEEGEEGSGVGGNGANPNALFARQGRIRASREVLSPAELEGLVASLRQRLTPAGHALFARGRFKDLP